MGYADDLATRSTSKHNLDRAIDIVAAHGRTWRYDFNAKKSGILVYGEERAESIQNVSLRSFRLGPDKVSERTHYDHVGIRESIFEDDVSGLEERVSKARRTLNAISGLGVRRCGLTIRTCNTIFWSVVIPIAMYGCELLFLTEGHITILEEFQEYAGRKLQRFHVRSPRACSFYTLGWVRLERYVEIRKLFFYTVFFNSTLIAPLKLFSWRERGSFSNTLMSVLIINFGVLLLIFSVLPIGSEFLKGSRI